MSMNEKVKRQERLSVVLDEFDASPSHQQALDEVLLDVNEQYAMRRYQMVGEVLRNELPAQVNTHLTASIMSQIEREDSGQTTPATSTSTQTANWWAGLFKPLAGLAVAASVAVVSIGLWQTLQLNQTSGSQSEQVAKATDQQIKQFAAMKANTAAVPASGKLGNGTTWKLKRNSPAVQQKLNGYLVNHTEYSNAIQGLIKQANVAGFDAQK